MVVRPRFDPTNVDLTDFDLAAMLESDVGRMARTAAGAAATGVREATYVTVGFTLLGVQRLQVRRRELEQSLRR